MLAMSDKCKPAVFRTATTFVMFMGADALDKLGKGDLTDAPVTVAISEIGVYNGLPKLRGQIVPGHHAAEAFERQLQKDAAAVQKSETK